MERDKYRQEGGDLSKDLEEKEGSGETFDSKGAHVKPGGPGEDSRAMEGVMGDSRPDRIDPSESHFVDGSDDPNMRIARRSSEITQPDRDGAEELAKIRHDDSTIVARPQPPLMEEGAELRPLSGKQAEEGEDS